MRGTSLLKASTNSRLFIRLFITAIIGLALIGFGVINYFGMFKENKPQLMTSVPLQQSIESAFQQSGMRAAAITIVKNGKISFRSTFAGRDFNETLSPQTLWRSSAVFDIALAILAMNLAEKGQLSFDRDISDYLGFSVRNPHAVDRIITLRHLFTHTAGLAALTDSHRAFFGVGSWQSSDALCADMQTAFTQHADKTNALFERMLPGERHVKSKLGTALIMCALLNVAELPIEALFETEVFKPLGMKNTSWLQGAAVISGAKHQYCFGDIWCSEMLSEDEGIFAHLPVSMLSYISEQVEYKEQHSELSVQQLFERVLSLQSTSVDITRLVTVLMDKQKIIKTQILFTDSVEELFMVQFPLSEAYTQRLTGTYKGGQKYEVASYDAGHSTYIIQDRKREDAVILLIANSYNQHMQSFIQAMVEICDAQR